ncbi:DUF3343 domain-containing protein [Oceanirhabdus sp. W0125-5]|uniref:DUF3343 domain-containing protein n=1 Tax=Oceanirhabdus sp. W0125-5 TaxID=2999116 RepID=UPI0022F3490A|nr:DUF3343 domain-containing protein [Oceanirhabdus sp. W0125-5]WBW95703.1 DUF3343 domain-containing protein [Oceanirhabdus sp. W0125-5]
MTYFALFFTYTGAIKYEKFLKSKGCPCKIMPVPRKLTSNCGVGAKFTFEEDINSVISEDIEKLFKVDGEEYTLIYEEE